VRLETDDIQGDTAMDQCSRTGRLIRGPGDGVWDDGEWVSWEWINDELYEQELRARYPCPSVALVHIFEDLVSVAMNYRDMTGRYLPVFGELGELFAEIAFGITRHKPRAQGSDGRLGDDFIEIKTITPEKKRATVSVKRNGHFNKLIVVKISEDFEFEARIVDRKQLKKGSGKYATVSWSSMKMKSE
jgi:hypothetical protein